MILKEQFLTKPDAVSVNISFANSKNYAKCCRPAPYGYICLCVRDDGTPYSEDFVVFWANTSSPNKEIVCEGDNGLDPYSEKFSLNLNSLPDEVHEILFCIERFLTDNSDFEIELNDGDEKGFHTFITNEFGYYVEPKAVLVLKLIKEEKWKAHFFSDEIDALSLIDQLSAEGKSYGKTL